MSAFDLSFILRRSVSGESMRDLESGERAGGEACLKKENGRKINRGRVLNFEQSNGQRPSCLGVSSVKTITSFRS